MEKEAIRVAVYQDSGMWVAQCLEYDICAQATDMASLQDRFEATLSADLEQSLKAGGEPFAGVPPPPADVLARFKSMSENVFTLKRESVSNPKVPDYEMALCA